jgi:hypothetical protein
VIPKVKTTKQHEEKGVARFSEVPEHGGKPQYLPPGGAHQ